MRSVPDRPGHDRRYSMDGSKLRALGWEPKVTFTDGIARTVDWYVANEKWWREMRDQDWSDYYARQYGWRLEQSVEA